MILYVVAPIQTKLQGAFETNKFYLADNVVDHRLKLPRKAVNLAILLPVARYTVF